MLDRHLLVAETTLRGGTIDATATATGTATGTETTMIGAGLVAQLTVTVIETEISRTTETGARTTETGARTTAMSAPTVTTGKVRWLDENMKMMNWP